MFKPKKFISLYKFNSTVPFALDKEKELLRILEENLDEPIRWQNELWHFALHYSVLVDPGFYKRFFENKELYFDIIIKSVIKNSIWYDYLMIEVEKDDIDRSYGAYMDNRYSSQDYYDAYEIYWDDLDD